MLARDLAERVPVLRPTDSALEAARLIASLRLAGVVVGDDAGHPVAVLQGSQVLKLVVPRYVREDPRLAHAYDEAGADELCAALAQRTVADLLEDDDVTAAEIPSVLPQDTLIEIAAVMVREHAPVVVIRDEQGESTGVVTLSRVMAAVLSAAGNADARVERTLERDLVDLERDGLGGPPTSATGTGDGADA